MGKKCNRCGAVKDESEFKWLRAKDRRDSLCRPCRTAYQREHYLKHRQRYIERAGRRRKRVIIERTAFIIGYLAEHPCADCGEKDPVVLEFDHLDEKSFEISQGIRHRKWTAVLEEIEKCEVVCVNCHRRRTARRRGSTRLILLDEADSDL